MKTFVASLILLFLIIFCPVLSAFIDDPEYCPYDEKYYGMENALKEPEKVHSLDIAMLKLTVIPSEISKFVNLICLDISFNRITDLPKEIEQLKNLRFLNLSGTYSLNHLPKVLQKLPALEIVDLTDHPAWKKEQYDEAIKLLPKVKFIRDDKYQK